MSAEPTRSGCLAWLLGPFARLLPDQPVRSAAASAMPEYALVAALLTPAEYSFFRVLSKACRGRGVFVAPKVRLADLLTAPSGPGRQAAFNRIASKHVDFLVCRADTSAPLAAVELDDSSHARKARRERDAFVDAALSAAGLRLVRIAAAREYSVDGVATSLFHD